MLEDQLLELGGFEDHRVLIERAYPAGKPDAVQQVYGHVLVALPRSMEKRFLDVRNRHGSIVAVALEPLPPRLRWR